MDPVIRASGLTKVYRRYARPSDRLFEAVMPSRRHQKFAALEDVSFDVSRGESVGLIGENGAGKSTLLKLVCGVARQTAGTLETRGSVASILELGTGFHPEFTGRDNAALNAAILGLGPEQIRSAIPRIVEFAELGAFIDRPVRTYSSGMYMRLAFSVAVMVDPEILVIDEALAVGDGYFQKKCVDKIREFKDRGRTILFCSHAMYLITTLCERTIWLEKGKLRRIGPSADVVHEYESALLRRESERRERTAERPVVESPEVNITGVEVTLPGHPDRVADSADGLTVRVSVRAASGSVRFRLKVVVVRGPDGMHCCSVDAPGDAHGLQSGRTSYEIAVRFPRLPLARSDYDVLVRAEPEDGALLIDSAEVASAFTVSGRSWEIGLLRVDHSWADSAGRGDGR